MNGDGGSRGQYRVHAVSMKTPARFTIISDGDIPDHLPQTERSKDAEDYPAAWPHELRKSFRDGLQIRNAIQSREVGKHAVIRWIHLQCVDRLSLQTSKSEGAPRRRCVCKPLGMGNHAG